MRVLVPLAITLPFMGCQDGGGTPHAVNARPVLFVPPKALDIGEVQEDGAFATEIPIRNASARPVTIIRFERPCVCVAIEPSSLDLAPGQSASLLLRLDLTKASEEERGLPSRPFETSFTPILADSGERTAFRITGTVKRFFELSGEGFSLGEVAPSEMPHHRARLTVTPLEPIEQIAVDLDPSLGEVERAETDRADGSCSFDIYLKPIDRAGAISIPLLVRAQTRGGTQVRRTIAMSAIILGELVSRPRSLALGAVPLAIGTESTFTIRSRDGVPFEVESIDATEGIEVTPEPAEEGATSLSFRSVCRPATPGEGTGTIKIEARLADGTSVSHDIAVSWHGLASQAEEGAR